MPPRWPQERPSFFMSSQDEEGTTAPRNLRWFCACYWSPVQWPTGVHQGVKTPPRGSGSSQASLLQSRKLPNASKSSQDTSQSSQRVLVKPSAGSWNPLGNIFKASWSLRGPKIIVFAWEVLHFELNASFRARCTPRSAFGSLLGPFGSSGSFCWAIFSQLEAK